MSRFSKAEAEKLGWKFVHEAEETVLNTGDNQQGISKKVPQTLVAEKYVDLPGREAVRTTEEAPTLGLLLERIHEFEQHLKARAEAPDVEVDARQPDEDPNPDKQEAKQNAESERVVAAAKVEGLSPADPGTDDDELDSLTVKQLKSLADEKGVTIKGLSRKAKLIAAIRGEK